MFTKQATTAVFFFPAVVEPKWLKTQTLDLERPAFKSWLPVTSWVTQLLPSEFLGLDLYFIKMEITITAP